MAKVLEGPGMGLMKKWGLTVPNYVVVTSVDELAKLGQANEWLKKSKLVVKAHEALGSRFKLGLVRSEEHTSELQSRVDLVCRLLLEKKKKLAQVPMCSRAEQAEHGSAQ